MIQSPKMSSPSWGHNNSLFPCWSLCFHPSIHSTCNCHINFPNILLYHVTNWVQEAMSNTVHVKFKPPELALSPPPLRSSLPGAHILASFAALTPHVSTCLTPALLSLPWLCFCYPSLTPIPLPISLSNRPYPSSKV